MMAGFIRCKINGVGHLTIGVDRRDLGNALGLSDMYFVAPSDEDYGTGFPDTEYAFFDMTYDADIGERTNGVKDVGLYDLADYSLTGGLIADEPPDY